MSEPKPCPFCKCKTSELTRERRYCDNCDCVASEDRWNTRPIEDELRAKLKIAEKAFMELIKQWRIDHDESAEREIVSEALARIRE